MYLPFDDRSGVGGVCVVGGDSGDSDGDCGDGGCCSGGGV